MIRCRRAVASSSCINRTTYCGNAVSTRHYATPVDGPIEGDGVVRVDRPLIRKIPANRPADGYLIRKYASARSNEAREREQKPEQSREQKYERNKAKYAQERGQRQSFPKPPRQQRVQRRCLDTYGRACSVLTSSPQSTPLADLLAQIPKLEAAKIRKTFGLFVFLVTPAYASSARQEKDLVEETIQRIYPGGSGVHGLHSLVAVVDKLPRPTASHIGDAGSEGVAYMFTDDVADAPDIFEQDPGPEKVIRDIASSFQIRRSLTFNIMSEQAYESTGEREGNRPDSRLYSVQLPLANTIFQNGLPSTLIHARYDKVGKDLARTSTRHLNNQTLRVPFFAADEQGANLALTAPLVPLTSARSVVACMGNIVRRLSIHPHTPSKTPEDDTILASHELEETVQAYFKARSMPPQTVSVWALIVPKEAFSAFSNSMADVLHPQNLTQRWKDNTLNWIESVKHTPLSLLQHHARLHKVLSGGGGWGKKAGLLSLDPDSSYTTDESSSREVPFFAGLELEMDDQESALRDIVGPGDYIQFYISPTAPTDHAVVKQDSAAAEPERNPQHQSADFGTIPSTIDTIPAAGGKTDNAWANLKLYPNHFGALSEVGIALTLSRQNGHKVEQLNQTKVDVPFGRFTLLSRGNTASSSPPGFGDAEQRKSKIESLWEKFQDSGEPAKKEDDRPRPSRIDFTPTKPMRFTALARLDQSNKADGPSRGDKRMVDSLWSAIEEDSQHQSDNASKPLQVTYMLPGKKRGRSGSASTDVKLKEQSTSAGNDNIADGCDVDDSPSDVPPPKFSTVKSRQNQERKDRAKQKLLELRNETQPKEADQGGGSKESASEEADAKSIFQLHSSADEDKHQQDQLMNSANAVESNRLSAKPRLENIVEPSRAERYNRKQLAREFARKQLEETRAKGAEKIHEQTEVTFPTQLLSVVQANREPATPRNAKRGSIKGLAGQSVRKHQEMRRMRVEKIHEHTEVTPSTQMGVRKVKYGPLVRNCPSEPLVRTTKNEQRGPSLEDDAMHLPEPAQGSQRTTRRAVDIEDSVRQLLGL